MDEVVENSVEVEDQRALDTYEPNPVYESDPDADNVPDVPVISHEAVPADLELLRLSRLQNPHVNLQKGEQLERHLC